MILRKHKIITLFLILSIFIFFITCDDTNNNPKVSNKKTNDKNDVNKEKSSNMNENKDTQFIELAKKKAVELGYNLEKMKIETTKKKDEIIIKFSPPPSQLGGDLTIKINLNDTNLINIIRGQ